MSIDRAAFVEPSFTGPLDVDAYLRLVQPGATVKGMQFQGLLDECAQRGRPIPGRRYVGFRDYPGGELVELLAMCAERLYPAETPREGLRRLGRIAYPTLKRSLLGKIIFSAVGNDITTLLKLVTKAYSLSGNTGHAEVLEVGDDEAFVRLEEIYTFIDAWHVGIIEGAVTTYAKDPIVKIKRLSPKAADFWVQWTRLG